jgi:hypothetical protein
VIEMAKKWLKGAIKNPGALHRKLGVPEGEKIPADKLEAATHSKNPTTRRQANLAETMKGFKHRSPSDKRKSRYAS